MYATLGSQSKVIITLLSALILLLVLLFQCCNMLLKNLRANVNLMNDNKNTALILAVINDNCDIVRILLK